MTEQALSEIITQLPDGWRVAYTPDHKAYYQNDITKQTQWNKPTETSQNTSQNTATQSPQKQRSDETENENPAVNERELVVGPFRTIPNETVKSQEEQSGICSGTRHPICCTYCPCCDDDPDVSSRCTQYSFSVIIPLFLMIASSSSPISSLIGLSILLMYIVYFSMLAHSFRKATHLTNGKYLFRIYSRAGAAYYKDDDKQVGWSAPVHIALGQDCYPLQAIHSISEFSAIDGSIYKVMLANLGQYTWCAVSLHYFIRFTDENFVNWFDIIEIIGVLGLVMIGAFEADSFNPTLMRYHMIGAFAGFGTVLGYVMQATTELGEVRRVYFDTEWDDETLYGYRVVDATEWDQEAREEEYHALLKVIASMGFVLMFIMFYSLWQHSLAWTNIREAEHFGAPNEEIRKGPNTKCCACCHWLTRNKDACVECEKQFQYDKLIITDEMKREITYVSYYNVFFEGFLLFTGATALSLFLMGSTNSCEVEGGCGDQTLVIYFSWLIWVIGIIFAIRYYLAKQANAD